MIKWVYGNLLRYVINENQWPVSSVCVGIITLRHLVVGGGRLAPALAVLNSGNKRENFSSFSMAIVCELSRD